MVLTHVFFGMILIVSGACWGIYAGLRINPPSGLASVPRVCNNKQPTTGYYSLMDGDAYIPLAGTVRCKGWWGS